MEQNQNSGNHEQNESLNEIPFPSIYFYEINELKKILKDNTNVDL